METIFENTTEFPDKEINFNDSTTIFSETSTTTEEILITLNNNNTEDPSIADSIDITETITNITSPIYEYITWATTEYNKPTPTTTPLPLTPIIEEYWTTTQICLTVIPTTLIMIFIILGNLLVIVAILTQKNLRTPSNIYILSLALTDIFVGICILPLNVYEMINMSWGLGTVICRIWITSDVTLCSSSILHISAIAVDRFRSINEGLAYAQSRSIRQTILVCCSLWFIALWIASPPVLGWNDWAKEDTHVCQLTRQLGYIVHSATGAFFIPAFVMIGLYIRIYFLLRKKFRERSTIKCMEMYEYQSNPSQDDLDSGDTGIGTGNNSSGEVIEEKGENSGGESKPKKSTSSLKTYLVRKSYKMNKTKSLPSKDVYSTEDESTSSNNTNSLTKSNTLANSNTLNTKKKSTLENFLKKGGGETGRKHSEQINAIMKKKLKYSLNKERKAAKTLGILIGAFLISWTPFTLTYLTSGIQSGIVSITFFQIVTWLGYVNSAINPIIYSMYSLEFKNAFKKILSRK